MWELTHRAFMLCLLGADVSVRAPLGGLQALHILCGLGSWSAVLSNHFVDLACILIKFGNADVSAVTNDGWCPTGLAYWRGWKEEWKTALGLCGYDPEEVVRTAVERWQKHGSVGLGESTAVDVEDFVTSWSGISRRKNITGDRLTD